MYQNDLTASQWEIIKEKVNHQRKHEYELRGIFNAIFYILQTGCQWRYLPKDFAPW